MDVFGFLEGISPWWWIAFGMVLGVVEMVSFSFFLIWPGLAAIAVGLMMVIFPSMSGSAQIGLFAILAIVFTLLGRFYVGRYKAVSDRPGLNERNRRLIGRQVVAAEDFVHGEGAVTVKGVRWSARLEPGQPDVQEGAGLRVTAVDGMTLIVVPRDS